MAKVGSFRDLLVWQRSIQLALAVYKLTSVFPREEIYGLTSQIRRASVSVASNIAEGQGRSSTGEFLPVFRNCPRVELRSEDSACNSA
jgi:four helix bundle protein